MELGKSSTAVSKERSLSAASKPIKRRRREMPGKGVWVAARATRRKRSKKPDGITTFWKKQHKEIRRNGLSPGYPAASNEEATLRQGGARSEHRRSLATWAVGAHVVSTSTLPGETVSWRVSASDPWADRAQCPAGKMGLGNMVRLGLLVCGSHRQVPGVVAVDCILLAQGARRPTPDGLCQRSTRRNKRRV